MTQTSSISNRGRPSVDATLVSEITRAIEDKLPLPQIVEQMKGRVSQTKVYEISRSMKFAPVPSTNTGPDAADTSR